jgi:hypothetical protein
MEEVKYDGKETYVLNYQRERNWEFCSDAISLHSCYCKVTEMRSRCRSRGTIYINVPAAITTALSYFIIMLVHEKETNFPFVRVVRVQTSVPSTYLVKGNFNSDSPDPFYTDIAYFHRRVSSIAETFSRISPKLFTLLAKKNFVVLSQAQLSTILNEFPSLVHKFPFFSLLLRMIQVKKNTSNPRRRISNDVNVCPNKKFITEKFQQNVLH